MNEPQRNMAVRLKKEVANQTATQSKYEVPKMFLRIDFYEFPDLSPEKTEELETELHVAINKVLNKYFS